MPEQLFTVLLLTTLAGLAIPAGGLLARLESIKPDWLETEFRHAVMAFGGGALLAAVALVLIPQGSEQHNAFASTGLLLLGGVLFMGLDWLLARSDRPASQLTAALTDFLPEAVALGAAATSGGSGAWLLALLITLQNLPEGFGAFREMRDRSSTAPRTILGLFLLAAALGPAAGLLGLFFFSEKPAALGALMLVAAGGILYLIFQDIAPQAKLEKHWAPPLAAVLGVATGLFGHMMLH